jgi:hypothetical protein
LVDLLPYPSLIYKLPKFRKPLNLDPGSMCGVTEVGGGGLRPVRQQHARNKGKEGQREIKREREREREREKEKERERREGESASCYSLYFAT